MKKIAIFTACFIALASSLLSAQGLDSLREQSLEIQDPAQPLKNFPKENSDLPLNYIQQPPLIPHHIRGYEVDRKTNKCLTCHSFKNFKRFAAPKISTSHFYNREDEVLSDVSPRRYFCLQCHVPQVQAKPLIGNTFEPAGALAE